VLEIYTSGKRFVAKEGDNFKWFLRYGCPIVFPSFHGLVCDTKQLSNLKMAQAGIDAFQPKVFTKDFRNLTNRCSRRNAPSPPMFRRGHAARDHPPEKTAVSTAELISRYQEAAEHPCNRG